MDLQNKRKFFLEMLEKHSKDILTGCGFSIPGWRGRFERIAHHSNIYVPYLLWKFHIVSKKNTTTTLFFGKKIHFEIVDPGDFFFSVFGCYGGAEYKLTKFLIKNLTGEDIFYDIGANRGFYTYLALEFCKEVHAFEPIPDICRDLKNNIEDKESVFVNEVALADVSGHTQFYETLEGRLSSTMSASVLNSFGRKAYRNIEVQTMTLSDYFKAHKKPTIIKLDVEGVEDKVLDGGKDFFRTGLPMIAMEVWKKSVGGDISMKAVEKLRSFGYTSYHIDTNGNIKKQDGDLSLCVEEEGLPNDNFIFKK